MNPENGQFRLKNKIKWTSLWDILQDVSQLGENKKYGISLRSKDLKASKITYG